MPRKLRPTINFNQPHFMQISESHCGPAVIQMLLSRLGVEVSQEDIAEAGGATSLIELNGMRVDQLAQAVHRLAPRAYFYYKDNSTIDELARIVNDYHTPAGVEWQGVFDDDDDDEDDFDDVDEDDDDIDVVEGESEDDDYGHYSLVTHADRRRRQLIITDPYKDYFSQARVFSFNEFDVRWYDYNEVADPVSGKSTLIKDDHLLFVVVPRNVYFPMRMGMRSYPR